MKNIIMIIVLITTILNGCSLDKSNSNNIDTTTNLVEIYAEDDYGSMWTNVGSYSTFLDNYNSKLYIIKDDKIFSTVNDYKYSLPILSSDGKEFISINIEQSERTKKYIFYLFNTEKMDKKLYTELEVNLIDNNKHELTSIFWNEQGIFALSNFFDKDYNLVNSDLITIDIFGNSEVVWENPHFSKVDDILNNWILYYSGENYIAHDLSTNESIIFDIFQRSANGLNDYRNMKFLESPTKLVGSKIYNTNQYYTFTYDYESDKIEQIYDELFIGFSTYGFAYKKYTGNENEYCVLVEPFDFK